SQALVLGRELGRRASAVPTVPRRDRALRRFPALLLRGLRGGVPATYDQEVEASGTARNAPAPPGQRPVSCPRARLLSDLLQRAQRNRQTSGVSLDGGRR